MKISFDKIDRVFHDAEKDNRSFLLEHEVYWILKEAGIQTPLFLFIKKGEGVSKQDLSRFQTAKLILKVVSPIITHKSDVGGVRFVRKNVETVNETIREMLASLPEKYRDWAHDFNLSERELGISTKEIEEDIRGFLVCEAVDYEKIGFGSELLLGLRSSREFGPIVTMGIGGVEVEYLNERLKEGKAVSIASAHLLQEEETLRVLEPLAFYGKLVNKFRGREPLISKEELIETYSRFIELGRYYSEYMKNSDFVIEEAEVNPFVISNKRLVALDGMCRFSRNHQEVKQRPVEKVKCLLKPQTIGIIGVSEKMNTGHIILNNILKQGFPRENVFVVKPGIKEIEGCVCIPDVSQLPREVDMFVLTVSAEQSYQLVKEIVKYEKARSIIIISGGIGEKEGTQSLENNIKGLLSQGRMDKKLTPVINGGNCLGIFSKPGKYNTIFIPDYKLYKLPRTDIQKSNLVYICQSGAFMISMMSKIPQIEPLYAVSIGNQIDLTVSDYLNYLKNDDEARIFAVYVEGFVSGDGLAFARAAREITRQKGKTVLVYKAGRSPEGRAATASHTASVAGDYTASRSILEKVGVVITETMYEFEDFIKNLCYLSGKKVRGNRVALVSNAGFECVVMSDNLKCNEELKLAEFSPGTVQKISEVLKPAGIDKLQDVQNPLDLTPMANDESFCRCVQLVLEDENVDCAVISPVPMTPAMETLVPSRFHRENIFNEGSTPMRLARIFNESDKPFVISIDSGAIYQPMRDLLEKKGVPTFRRCDDAVKFLRKYINRFLK